MITICQSSLSESTCAPSESIERSPNTVHTYASHLKLFWEFLKDSGVDWKQVSPNSLELMASFITCLRRPQPKVISIQPQEARRTERTVNAIISAVCRLYNFHYQIGNVEQMKVYSQQFQFGSRAYKPLLHGIAKEKSVQKNLLKLKEPKKQLETLTAEQVKQLIAACKRISN